VLSEVKGACPLDCPDTCAWTVTVRDGRGVSLAGARDHPFTRGALCGKVSHYLDGLRAPDRLLHPLRRVGAKGEGRFEETTWDDALQLVADRFEETIDRYGAEAILPYISGGTLGKIQMAMMPERLFGYLGASRSVDTICSAATSAAFDTTLGGGVGFDPEDLDRANLVLLWGTNTLSTNVHQWRFVLGARERGAHIVAIDPIRTETARNCDEHVQLFPGTDAALALGLMHVVVELGAHDTDWLGRHAVGWPALQRRIDEWPVERAAAVCQLDPAVLRSLGERLATSRPTAIRTLLGLQRHGGAGAAVRAICAIPAVTGDWRHVGGGVLAVTWGHSQIAVEHPSDLPKTEARGIDNSRLAEALTTTDDPPVKALFVMNANPAASCPALGRVRAGLAREDLFTVVADHRLTDTADFADVVLPATAGPEHLDVATGYGHHYVIWSEPAVEAPGECLPNTEIIRRLAAAMGCDHPRLSDSDFDLARAVLKPAGITPEQLRTEGWARVANFERGTAPFAEGGFPTPSGKVELTPNGDTAGAVDYVPSHEISDEQLAQRFPLVLIAAAGRFLTNSTFAASGWHLKKTGPPRIQLHPDDAASRGLDTGDHVEVSNDRGAFSAEVVVTDDTRPGVAFTQKSYWPKKTGGTNVNSTTAERDADLGRAPTFHDNRVQVARATIAR